MQHVQVEQLCQGTLEHVKAFFTSAFVWQLAETAKREVTLALALRLQKVPKPSLLFFCILQQHSNEIKASLWLITPALLRYQLLSQGSCFQECLRTKNQYPGWAVNHPQQEQLPNQTKIPTELFFLFQHTKKLSHKCSLPLSRTQAIQYPQLSLSTSHSVSCLPFYTKQLVPAD